MNAVRIARRIAVVVVLVALGALAFFLYVGVDPGSPDAPPAFTADHRPQAGRHVFDYANSLTHYEEAAQRYLQDIAARFHIEALIVTLPDLAQAGSVQQLAVRIANRWQIGRNYEGRGLLLLLVHKQEQVKLEVSYELEDVFTDAFTGYIEDLQLKPYFRAGDIGSGLIAVMEELERRAQIKHQGEYTPGMIARLDAELLAGGAGSGRKLAKYRSAAVAGSGVSRPSGAGASSPEKAWSIMLKKWAGQGAHIEADIYTEMTKLAMGDQNNPDQRVKAGLTHWQDTPYRVLEDGDHAAIYFGNAGGWNNAPFLFCRTHRGWKFDIVHQRRLVVMGPSPTWMVEQGRYPYVELLSEAPQSTGKDLPLPIEDLYDCGLDEEYAERIRVLEREIEKRPDDIEAVMALLRLNVITGRRPNHVRPLLQRAKRLDPGSAEPHKYAAIYNVNAFLQYKTALRDIETYIEKRPGHVFGYNFKGFLLYRLGEYRDSIDALEHAATLSADNVYAYALMARDYALLLQKSNDLDPRRSAYRRAAIEMLERAQAASNSDPTRVARLRAWLSRRGVLSAAAS